MSDRVIVGENWASLSTVQYMYVSIRLDYNNHPVIHEYCGLIVNLYCDKPHTECAHANLQLISSDFIIHTHGFRQHPKSQAPQVQRTTLPQP